MKEVKFRIWDTKENKFFEPTYEAYKGNLSELLIGMSGQVLHRTLGGISLVDDQEGRWIKSMFTGLKDKNGKEIYEGDLIDLENKYLYEVAYQDAKFVLLHVKGNAIKGVKWGDLHRMLDPDFIGYDFKVIGNIYENPELLIPTP